MYCDYDEKLLSLLSNLKVFKLFGWRVDTLLTATKPTRLFTCTVVFDLLVHTQKL